MSAIDNDSLPHPSTGGEHESIAPTPLAGLTVLEFSHTIMGPCAGLLLADLGATVIKIEPAPEGDKTRQLPGFAAGFFATFNRNKRSVALNLKDKRAQEIVHEMARSADIVLDNYGPGTMERLGCGWETLQLLNPGLVYLTLKGYLKGPWQNRPALDEVVQFQSGLAYMTGPPGQPLRAGASIVDILGAVMGVTGVLAALRERDVTGKGQRVGSSLFESAAFLMASHMAGGAATGEQVPPMTARKGAWGIYDVFYSKDNEPLFIGVTSDAQWQRFCQEFSMTELANDQRLVTNPQRTVARDWLIPKLVEYFETLSHNRMIEGCSAADVSWSPVGRPEDLLTNEQLAAPGGLLSIALDTTRGSAAQASDAAATGGQMKLPGLPWEFGDDQRRTTVRMQPPELGDFTDEMLRMCGYTEAEVSKLREQGVAY